MAIKELQTAAVRFVHVIDPTDKELHTIQQRFHFNSSDQEAMIGAVRRSRVITCGDFLFVTLLWPIWNGQRQRFEVTPLRWCMNQDTVLVFDDGRLPMLTEFLQDFFRHLYAEWVQERPATLLYETMLRLMKHAFQEYLVINTHPLAHKQRIDVAAAWSMVLSTFDDMIAQATQQKLIATPELTEDFHFLRSLGKQVLTRITQATAPAAAPSKFVPSAVTGYAVAASMVFLLITLVVSR